MNARGPIGVGPSRLGIPPRQIGQEKPGYGGRIKGWRGKGIAWSLPQDVTNVHSYSDLKKMRVKVRKKAVQYLTEEEWGRFIGKVIDPRDRALFLLMYDRGLRASEMRMIRRSDVGFDRISVERLKGSTGGLYGMSVEVREAIAAWMLNPGCGQAAASRLFPISRIRIYQLFQKYGEEAGLPAEKRHPHILKHSRATHLLDLGLDIVDVQDWLGHKAIQNTMIYAQVTSKRRREAERRAYGC
jgi:type 1 fimbriae regulatory protein FimB